MRPCALCRKPREEEDYGLWHGKPKKTCNPCCERLKVRYWAKKDTPSTVPFEALIEAYDLTEDEAHAVDLAAGQSISYRRFKRRHKRRRWAGPTAEQVLEPEGRTVRRRCELLLAASLRAREIIMADGLDPRAFFSSHGNHR